METPQHPEVINPEVVEQEELFFIVSNPCFKRIRDRVNASIARLYRDVERYRKQDMALDASLAIAGKEQRIDELQTLLRFFDSVLKSKNHITGE